MTALIVVLGSLGVALFITGLPLLRRPTVAEKVAPYLPGSSSVRTIAPVGFFQRLASRVPGNEQKEAELARRLSEAGLRSTSLAFRAEQLAWASLTVAGVATITIVAAAAGLSMDAHSAPFLAGLGAACGYLGRDWWLGKQIYKRRTQLKEELPTAIDLMTIALIAGESPAAALARTSTVMQGSIGPEFDRILGDVRAGDPFLEAIHRARDTTSDHSFARFFDALITGIEKGAPLAEVLRAQADEVRHARGREMLEVAGRKEVLMLVPVVFLVMPVVVIYALFPGLAALDLFVP
jgi:tight adherence protein C